MNPWFERKYCVDCGKFLVNGMSDRCRDCQGKHQQLRIKQRQLEAIKQRRATSKC